MASLVADQHATHQEAWLVIKKNHVTDTGVFYGDAVEEALCFGWIDGLMKSASDEFYICGFRPGSATVSGLPRTGNGWHG